MEGWRLYETYMPSERAGLAFFKNNRD